MKKILLSLTLLFTVNAMAEKNQCLNKGICTCKDYFLILNDKLAIYNNSTDKLQKELRILGVNSYMNSLYTECRNTDYYKKDIVQKNKEVIKQKIKTEVRKSLQDIEANKPLY